MNQILANWRTTALGAVAIIVTVGFAVGTVSEHVFMVVLGMLAAGVGAVAGDASAKN